MHIIIKEESSFMPDTIIRIYEDKIEVEEKDYLKILNYNQKDIKNIMNMLVDITKRWKRKYVDKAIIDDVAYVITFINDEEKVYYVKNSYPQNWEKFIYFRNRLVREELKF